MQFSKYIPFHYHCNWKFGNNTHHRCGQKLYVDPMG